MTAAISIRSLEPSRWSRRIPLAVIALAGAAVAAYLASYQVGIVKSVWDPISATASDRVLHSALSRSLPVPDAALGAVAYLAEFATDLIGGSERWRRQPWAVLLFGAVVAALALTSVVLVAYQLFVVRAICALCLASAGLSFVAAALAAEEVLATIDWLRGETAMGRSLVDAALHGDAALVAPTFPPRANAAVRRHRLAPVPATQPTQETDMSDTFDPTSTGATSTPGSTGSTGSTGSPSMATPRPGGPDVDGGNEQVWREPDKSVTAKDHSGVVVVAGAAAGLGRAIAREFAKHGYDVGLIARDEGSLENARAEVESVGRRAVVCPVDVSDADAVDQAADTIERELGPIDVWVNDAMVSVFSPVKEMKPEGYKQVTDVNYLGYVYGTLAALKRMLPRDHGHIVHVGSALAYRSIPLQSAYCASKHAILGFHTSLRTELLHDKSHVVTTMVQMPALNTPQFDWVKNRLPDKPQPVPPIFQPEVGAEAVYWAAHHDRREVFVGASTWGAIQANKFVPDVLDWYLAKTGYQSQQTSQPDDPNRPNDVWEPVPGDHGAHGAFDAQAKPRSAQVWATTHRGMIATGVGLAGLAALAGLQAVTSLMRSDRGRG